MSKFKDGAGIEREIRLDTGLIEDIIERRGIELDTLFIENPAEIMLMLYGKPRQFTPVLADLCRLSGDDAKAFARGLDADSLEAGRTAFLDALSSFFLPPGKRGAFLKGLAAAMTTGDESLDGSNKPTESAVPSDSIPALSP